MIAQLVCCKVSFTALVMGRNWVSFVDLNPSKFALFVRLWRVRSIQLPSLLGVIFNSVMQDAWCYSVDH